MNNDKSTKYLNFFMRIRNPDNYLIGTVHENVTTIVGKFINR